MRTWLPQYEMRSAGTLGDALAILAKDPGVWTPFAGGTDLMVLLEAGTLPQRRLLNIWGLPELRGIDVEADHVALGALTTYTEILEHATVCAEFPLLAEAARLTGAVAIQNRGTIGGNIANASPAADLPPALLVYDARVDLVSARGRRRVSYEVFHQGYKQRDLAPDELIAAVIVPRAKATWRQSYRKVGTRRAQAISKVCFAAAADLRDGVVADIRIALGSVAPTVVRAREAESVLRGSTISPEIIAAARSALARDITPIDDIRSTAAYRRQVAGNLLEDFLS